MKSLKRFLLMAIVVTVLVGAGSGVAFAQRNEGNGGSVGNGGDVKESQILGIVRNIEYFLNTKVGSIVLPEVNRDLFSKAVAKTDVEIVRHKLRDKKGNLRSAINIKGENRNWILFRQKALNKAAKRESAVLVILIFHEYLNLIDLELNVDDEATSSYTISNKIAPYADTILHGRFGTN